MSHVCLPQGKIAVPGKRLFWISIIIVELVFGYVLWRPFRDHLKRSHRAALNSPDRKRPEMRLPEMRQPDTQRPKEPQPQTKAFAAAVIPPRKPSLSPSKPSAGVRSTVTPHRKSIVINAGLKTPEPIPSKPVVAPPPTGLAESFWCHISMVQPQCDCKGKNNEQASSLVMQ